MRTSAVSTGFMGTTSSQSEGNGKVHDPDFSAVSVQNPAASKSRLIYALISSRAAGLSIGINMNPNQECNFDCVYCDVNRSPVFKNHRMNIRRMSSELKEILERVRFGKLRELPDFANVPEELLILKNVALSGDGEPTLCSNFCEVVEEVSRIRSDTPFPPYKVVLVTNGTGLQSESVQRGLHLFSPNDEVWIKLDAGTPESMRLVNRTTIPMEVVLDNIIKTGRQRPVVIQSLFCCTHGEGPDNIEVEAYIQRLAELKAKGAQITLVQVYSVMRQPAHPGATCLSLARLSFIAKSIREKTGLMAEVF